MALTESLQKIADNGLDVNVKVSTTSALMLSVAAILPLVIYFLLKNVLK